MILTPSGRFASQIEALLAPYADDDGRPKCLWCGEGVQGQAKYCTASHRQMAFAKRKKEAAR